MIKSKVLKVLLVLTLIVVTGFTAIGAATVYQTITADLRPDISVSVDDKTLNLKDANGKEISPLLVEGSTYLPIRAIASATGLEVDWDDATQTVSLKHSTTNVGNEKFAVRGTVKNIVNGKDGITMLVEGIKENDTQYDKASVTVTRNSSVSIEGVQTLMALNYSEIKEGDIVEVTFTDRVTLSDPVMGVAESVNILSRAKNIGVRGVVKNIVNGKDGITMDVEGTLESDTQFDRATVTVNRDSIVTKEGIQTFVALTYSEIKIGDRVEVVFKGDVSKSDPVLAVAGSVSILKIK